MPSSSSCYSAMLIIGWRTRICGPPCVGRRDDCATGTVSSSERILVPDSNCRSTAGIPAFARQIQHQIWRQLPLVVVPHNPPPTPDHEEAVEARSDVQSGEQMREYPLC